MAAVAMTQAVLAEVPAGMPPAVQLAPMAAELLEAAAVAVAKVHRRGPALYQQSATQSVGYSNAQVLQVPSTAERQEAQQPEGLRSGGPANAALQGGAVPSLASARADADQTALTGQSQMMLAAAAVLLSIAAMARE
jgi:hypothetical protein